MDKKIESVLLIMPHIIIERKGQNIKYLGPKDVFHREGDWEIIINNEKYIISIFIDGDIDENSGDYDYIDSITFPNGKIIDFDELRESKLDFITYKNPENNYTFDDITIVEKYLTRAYWIVVGKKKKAKKK